MASKRDMEMGREFAGNGASSFDPRPKDYWLNAARDAAAGPQDPATAKIMAEVSAKLERAFGKWDRERGCYIPHPVKTGEAA